MAIPPATIHNHITYQPSNSPVVSTVVRFNPFQSKDFRRKRTMSKNAPTPVTKQFLVIVPDFPAKLEAREASTAAHVERVTPNIEKGDLSHFGVMLKKHPQQSNEAMDISGTFFVMKAESEQVLREFLLEDAFVKGGIWDLGNAQVFPCQAF